MPKCRKCADDWRITRCSSVKSVAPVDAGDEHALISAEGWARIARIRASRQPAGRAGRGRARPRSSCGAVRRAGSGRRHGGGQVPREGDVLTEEARCVAARLLGLHYCAVWTWNVISSDMLKGFAQAGSSAYLPLGSVYPTFTRRNGPLYITVRVLPAMAMTPSRSLSTR